VANSFYARIGSYVKATLIRAETHKAEYDGIVASFGLVETETKRALTFPSGEDIEITEAPGARQNMVVGTNSAGVPVMLALTVFPTDMDNVLASLATDDGLFYNASTLKWNNQTMDALRKKLWVKGADIASANALTPGTDGNYFDITGTTAITSIADTSAGHVIKLHFDGALTLTHHSTNLILPGGANITTAAGDEYEFTNYAAGDWRCTGYIKADGTAVIGISAASQAEQEAGSSTSVSTTPGRQQYHPSAAKGWIYWSADGTTINASHNVSSLDDNGVGDYGINWDVDFSSVNYATVAQTEDTDTGSLCNVHTITAGSIQIDMGTTGGTNADHPGFAVSFGDQ